MHSLCKLWHDDCGSGLVSMEIVFLGTILVLGLITGWVALRNGVTNEYEELANAFGALSQAYEFAGQSGCRAETEGSATKDDDCNRVRIKSQAADEACKIDGDPCDENGGGGCGCPL